MKLLSAETVRRCFIADPGYLIITSDFDQIELRIIAALANEPAMIAAAKKGISLHKLAAEKLFGKDYTPDQYKLSKNINFTWAFGGGAQKMADMYGILLGQARELITEYESQFPALRDYKRKEQNKILQSALSVGEFRALRELRSRMYAYRSDTLDGRRARWQISQEIKRLCYRKVGWTTNAFGRRLPVDAEKPYTVVNYNVQSTARDIMAHALLRVMSDDELESTVLLPIHDEILGQAPKRIAERIAERYGEVMTTEFMGVPLTASGKSMERVGGTAIEIKLKFIGLHLRRRKHLYDTKARWEYYWCVWAGWCKIGLHFMEYRFDLDGYRCPCGYQYLWNEQIRQ